MNEQALINRIDTMLAQMTAMQSRIEQLESEVHASKHTTGIEELAPVAPPLKVSRQRMLRRLAGGMLAGLAAGGLAATMPDQAAARLVSKVGGRIGAIITAEGDNANGNLPGSGFRYGLIALGGSGDYNLALDSDVLQADTSVFARTGSQGIGVYATGGKTGVFGKGSDYAVRGDGGDTGVFGYGTNVGVRGDANVTGVYGTGGTYGVFGSGPTYGVYAFGNTAVYANGGTVDQGHTGLYATGSTGISAYGNYGVYSVGNYYAFYGQSSGGFAGYFAGRVHISGTFSKPSGSFKIDHPLDPANKYLYHSFVESPDMMNIYNGIVRLDAQGEAVIEMPDWFEALNTGFRYQLTCLENYAPVYIAQKMKERKFKIAGGLAGQEISWQVTGIRQDAWAKAHPIPVEEDKSPAERGRYMHPEEHGQPPDRGAAPHIRDGLKFKK